MDKILEHCLPAVAKLNINLHIKGRRADGLHCLSSRMVFIDLCDTVCLKIRQDGNICRRWTHEKIDEKTDLSMRAARLLQQYSATTLGVDIAVDKKIPLGSGLGGGSSNAATVLMGLNQLWGLHLEKKVLMDLAVQLGADVPFFIFGRCADSEGIGERLQAINYKQKYYLLAFSAEASCTAKVFNCFDKLTKEKKIDRIEPLKDSDNQLSSAATMLYPSILSTAKALQQVVAKVQLSGSGSTVFASFSTLVAANKAKASLRDSRHAVVVSGLLEHPIQQYWGVAKR